MGACVDALTTETACYAAALGDQDRPLGEMARMNRLDGYRLRVGTLALALATTLGCGDDDADGGLDPDGGADGGGMGDPDGGFDGGTDAGADGGVIDDTPYTESEVQQLFDDSGCTASVCHDADRPAPGAGPDGLRRLDGERAGQPIRPRPHRAR